MTLPGAPGSLDGMGSNAISEGNQGALTYAVNIDVPRGFPGLTPQLALSYNSNAGSTVAGLGWSLPTFSIERRTLEGLQKYDVDDVFVADGSSELVRVAQDANTATYRARFEGVFARYTWRARGTGEGGWWRVEMPDGTVGYYGADSSGNAVTTAQVTVPGSTPERVFRWHLVAMADPFGHEMRFTWVKSSGGAPLLSRIDYVFDGATPRHSVRMTYETREDLLSDARPGFELTNDQRLKDFRIYSGNELVRAYVLAWESASASGGQSRLQKVSRFGRGNEQFPVVFSFGYTQSLGATCANGCDKPFVVDMGTIGGVDFSTGRASLVDINGDALPDVLYSDPQGTHSFYDAKLDSDGHASFSMTPHASSKTVGGSAFLLGDPKTQLLDLDGNGFVDLAQATTASVLCNDGSGDWVDAAACTGGSINLPSSAMADDTEATQADPRYVRFFDYDNDRRIDWLRTFSGGTASEVLANTPQGFTSLSVENVGATFDEDPLQLADMNGDGLQDPVMLVISGNVVQARYRLNLGRGRWGAWKTITVDGLDTGQASVAELEDLNGDGLADVVSVTGSTVSVALNRNGEHFAAVRELGNADLETGNSMPTRTTGTTVVFADMNANGSSDVVWIQSNGRVQYLELFPVRPNLLTRIENAVGSVELITWGSSVAEQARDTAAGAPWPDRLPHPATVVKRLTSYVTLTGSDTAGLREVTTFDYHAGYYDGVEKQFRGYATTQRQLGASEAQEPGVITTTWDLGKTNVLFAGTALTRRTSALNGTSEVLLREERWLNDACAVADLPSIQYLCERAFTTIHVERDASQAVTTRVERDYDGYGNTVAERELGVINLGTPESPGACAACSASGVFGAACGATCEGDEWYTQTEYVVPGTATSGAWFLRKSKRELTGAVSGMAGEERLTFYDGPAFEGLASGQLTRGAMTREMARKGAGAQDFIASERHRIDAHGNEVESIEPGATASGTLDGRETKTYDSTGLNLLSSEMSVAGANGMTALRAEFAWDTAWEEPSQVSGWFPVAGTTPLQSPQFTSNRYDNHGRVLRQLDPNETDATASLELSYELASPASRVLAKRRTATAGAQELQTASCFDGRGRLFQKRERLSASRWQVSGFVQFDARGRVARHYQPYLGTTGDCDTAPPTGVLSSVFTFDVLGRALSETQPDGTVVRTEYLPLQRREYDEQDSDAQASFTGTPTVHHFDGRDRIISVSRLSEALGTGTPAVTRVQYDALGNISTVVDPLGNLHAQVYGPLQRLLSVTDPNRGTVTLELDDRGNELSRTDARGKVTRTVFDVLNRPLERFDAADETGTRTDWTYDFISGCLECTNTGFRVAQLSWSGPLSGTTRSGYDQKGRLAYSERLVGSASLATRYGYDEASRPVSVTWPGGLSLQRSFDGADRVTALSGLVSSITYDDRGDTEDITYANGVKSRFTRDGRQRVTSLKTLGADGTALLDLGYGWSPRGDLLSITDGAREGRACHSGAFTYDAYGRLRSASLGREGADEVLSFTFDELDNLLSKTSSLGDASPAHVGTYTYDATKKNAVASAGGVSYTYDEAGALIGRGALALTRDSEGRVITATRDGRTGDYAYAGDRRVAKREDGSMTLYLGDDLEVRDGIATAYARIGNERYGRLQTGALAALLYSDLAPATGAGTQLAVQGDGVIDISDAWLAQAAERSLLQLSGGGTPSNVDDLLRSSARRLLVEDVTALHSDHLMSAVLATSSDGTVRGERSYYPTGEERSARGFVDFHGFTGGEPDEVTGLLHFRYRELDVRATRWDRPDPAFERLDEDDVLESGEATVSYAYVRNNFAGSFDPSGLASLRGAWNSVKSAGKALGNKISTKATNTSKSAKAYLGRPSGQTNGDKARQSVQTLVKLAAMIVKAVSADSLDPTAEGKDDTLDAVATGLNVTSYVFTAYNAMKLGKKVASKLKGVAGKKDPSKLADPAQRNAGQGAAQKVSKPATDDAPKAAAVKPIPPPRPPPGPPPADSMPPVTRARANAIGDRP